MCHSRANYAKLNRLNERCLRIRYSDRQSSFETLLEKDWCLCSQWKSSDLCNWNVQNKDWPISSNCSRTFWRKRPKKQLSVHYTSNKAWRKVSHVAHGSESISIPGPNIWNILPDKLKYANSIEFFKTQIKKLKPEYCQCRLCKVYVQNISFA